MARRKAIYFGIRLIAPPKFNRKLKISKNLDVGAYQHSLMKLFFSFQHLDELLNLSGSSLSFLRSLYSKQNRVSICAIQCRKEGFCLSTLIQSRLEIGRHGGTPRRIIGRLPTSILLRPLNRI